MADTTTERKDSKKRTWPKKDASKKPPFQKKEDFVPRDLYQQATDALVAALEKGAAPWQRPWDYKDMGMPRNGTSEHQYTGVNPLLLLIEAQDKGYSDPRWATHKQAEEKGWNVKKGEKGTTIYFYKPMVVEAKDATGKAILNDQGEQVMKTIPMLKSYAVFNMAQMENPPAPIVVERAPNWTPVNAVTQIMESMGIPVIYGGNRAFYSPSLDKIQLPETSQFTGEDAELNHAAVLLHELGHGTAHTSRRARNLTGRMEGTAQQVSDYAFEELIAEITSLYTTTEIGLTSDANVERHAAYVQSWIQRLKEDKKAIFRACKEAEKAADWVMNRDRTPANAPKDAPKQTPVVLAPLIDLGSTIRFTSTDLKRPGLTEGVLVDTQRGFGDSVCYHIKQADEITVKVWSSKGTVEVLEKPSLDFTKPEKPAKTTRPKKDATYSIYAASSLDDVRQVVEQAGFVVKEAVDGQWDYLKSEDIPEGVMPMTGKYAAESNALYECAKNNSLDVPKTAIGVKATDGKRYKFDNPNAIDEFLKKTPDALPGKAIEEVMAKFSENHDKAASSKQSTYFKGQFLYGPFWTTAEEDFPGKKDFVTEDMQFSTPEAINDFIDTLIKDIHASDPQDTDPVHAECKIVEFDAITNTPTKEYSYDEFRQQYFNAEKETETPTGRMPELFEPKVLEIEQNGKPWRITVDRYWKVAVAERYEPDLLVWKAERGEVISGAVASYTDWQHMGADDIPDSVAKKANAFFNSVTKPDDGLFAQASVSEEETLARSNDWIPNPDTRFTDVVRLAELPSDTEVQDMLHLGLWHELTLEQIEAKWESLDTASQDAFRTKLQQEFSLHADDWKAANKYDRDFPATTVKEVEPVKNPGAHLETNANHGIDLVTEEGNRVAITHYDQLAQVMYDECIPSTSFEDLETQYWTMLPADEYARLTEQLFQERYGVTTNDITEPERVEAERVCGHHPVAMIEALAVKYDLTPKTEVEHPFSIGVIQPGNHFNPSSEAPQPGVIVPPRQFKQPAHANTGMSY